MRTSINQVSNGRANGWFAAGVRLPERRCFVMHRLSAGRRRDGVVASLHALANCLLTDYFTMKIKGLQCKGIKWPLAGA